MVDREKLESSPNMKFNIEGLNTIIYDPISMWDSIKTEKEKKTSKLISTKTKSDVPESASDSESKEK